MKNSLEVKDLTKKYKDFELKNISFTLPSGCIMGFIGENGAGKSTTIKIILNAIKADSGQALIFGQKNIGNDDFLRENVGVVIDDCCFPENICIKDINCIMKNMYKNWNTDTFFSFTKKFSLPEKKVVKDYSKGMKMKLSIAAALSHGAKLLILDEATSGLDPIVRDEILDVFLDFIQDEEHSVLLSSHIISDLEKICDYIAFIHKGRLVFNSQKDELIEKYGMLKCSTANFELVDKSAVKGCRKGEFGVEALVLRDQVKGNMVIDKASIEEIMLYHVKESAI